jgi:hypothetical protein
MISCQDIHPKLEGKWVFDTESYIKNLELDKSPNQLKNIIETQVKGQYEQYYLIFHQQNIEYFLGENHHLGEYSTHKTNQSYDLLISVKNFNKPHRFPLRINLENKNIQPNDYLIEKILKIEFKNNILHVSSENQPTLTFKKSP